MMHNYIAENTYTSQGTLAAWKHVQQSGSSVVTPVEECRKLGNFDYRKQGMKKFALERADFAYGYFDSEGVHWTLTDAIGSIELVVSGDGRVEQHTGYYPYGQPWRATAGQQRLFGGKELRTFGGLNDYDFHARFQNPAGPFFQSADRHAANTPALSPWTFAAANPIRYCDPTGLDIYTLDKIGNVISCVKNDTIDQVVVLDQGIRHESNTYKKGTIEKQFKVSAGKKSSFDYFQINGDDNAVEIYRFLADNTNVEFSLFQCGEVITNEVNFISTSHQEKTDVAGGHLFATQLKYGYTIRTHSHNHPSGSINPSEQDSQQEYTLKTSYLWANKIEFYIYVTGKGFNRVEREELDEVVITPK